MDEHHWLADRFEQNRARLRGVAYRILGSLSEADDAVQDAWIRISRADTSAVENLSGWMTTVVARVCLNMLQSRKSRREEQLVDHMPDPVVGHVDGVDPEYQALVADSVGLALLLVLEALTPAERVAFVLHDVFGISFEEIAPIVGRSPMAARQLASRARRRVQGNAASPDVDLARQREVVDAFLAAAREGDFASLVQVLDPDVVLRSDTGGGKFIELRGAETVARGAMTFSRYGESGRSSQMVLVNGAIGAIAWDAEGNALSVMGFIVSGNRIVEMDALADPSRLGHLKLSAFAT